MNKLFAVSSKFTAQLDNGTFKRVTKVVLLSAITHGEAEERCHAEVGAFVKGEFMITGVKPMHIHDVFVYDDSDLFWNVKIAYSAENEEGEKSRLVKQQFLITAHSVKDAYDRIKESLSTLMVDIQITGITQSNIEDYFPYVAKDEKATTDDSEESEESFEETDIDPLLVDAAKLVVAEQSGSSSLLQRNLALGYNRAGRIMDQLQQLGVVGPFNGTTERRVLFEKPEHLQEFFDREGVFGKPIPR